jgi:two-component system, OmpR family, sensor histidine kinase TctE
MAEGKAAGTPSLRRRLFAWLIGPAAALVVVSTLAAYATAYRFANQVYDNWITDTAVALAQLVTVSDSKVMIDLPTAAQQMLDSDQRDRIYYRVSELDGTFVGGHRGLPMPPRPPDPGAEPYCFDGALQGDRVRVAAYRPAGASFVVQVAETVNKRDTLALEIIASMLLPLVALVAIAAIGLWLVRRGLEPLTALAREIGGRSAHDLSPVDSTVAPLETQPLVRALNDLLARLGHVLAAQRRFVADAAHQLRTPLTGLKTQAELGLRTSDTAAVRSSLQQIVAGTDRTAHLVNQLLSLARAEPEGQVTVRRERLDLTRLARDTTADWIPRALEHGIDLGFEGAEPLWVTGDATLLRELTGNLIDNAIAYCPSGTEVTVAVGRDGPRALLTVTDGGPGVPETERERVFERFHRVLGAGAEGSGLGLAIVRQIAERHGGEAHLDAGAGGRGTCVRVWLPIFYGTAVAG